MKIQGGRWKGEGGVVKRLRSRAARSPFPLPPSSFRPGLTLIELLITITIVATLSAVFLGASRSAMESARAARTKSTIAKLHSLIMEKWVSYETRRVDVNPMILTDIDIRFPNLSDRGKALADVRLVATRELMKFEMPDRWSDFDMFSEPLFSNQPNAFLAATPALARIYYRRYQKALSVAGGDDGKVTLNGSAECLYLTIMLATGDGEARTLFSQQDIGDTDEDGAPEFLDGWGNPIRWVRWPAGFLSRSSLMSGDPESDHDPYDPFRRHQQSATPAAGLFSGSLNSLKPYIFHLRAPATAGLATPGFRLVPLIFSSGPDGIGDISTRKGDIADRQGDIALDPYAVDNSFNVYEFGSFGDNPTSPDGDDNSIDNIHNHLLDNR